MKSPYPKNKQMVKESQPGEAFDEVEDEEFMAKGGIVGPHPRNKQMREESQPGEAYDEAKDQEYTPPTMAEGGVVQPETEESPFILKLREYMLGNHSAGTSDIEKTQLAQNVDTSTDTAKGYADGGVVGPQDETDQEDPPEESIYTKPQQAPAQPAPQPLPGMGPQASPNDFQQFMAQNKAATEKYGPEQQMAVQQALIKGRTGLGMGIANAGAGFADALMQGVARAGNPGFQEKMTNQQNQLAGEAMGTMEKAQGGKMAQMKAQMSLSEQDASSLLSKSVQNAYGPQLKKMPGGESLTDAQIALIPASVMGDIFSKKVELSKALAEISNTQAWREASLGLQRSAQENTKLHERTEENIAKSGRTQGAAKALADEPFLKSVWATIPGTASHTAHKVLEQQATGGGENAPSGPYGDTTVRNGVTYQWSPTTGKYHPTGQ